MVDTRGDGGGGGVGVRPIVLLLVSLLLLEAMFCCVCLCLGWRLLVSDERDGEETMTMLLLLSGGDLLLVD